MTVRRNNSAGNNNNNAKAAAKPSAAAAKAAAAKAAKAAKAAAAEKAVAGGNNVELKAVQPKSSFKLPAGYVWRYTRKLYDMARKVDSAAPGADWFTVCNQHLTRVDAESGAEAEENGRSQRPVWCSGCKAAAAAAEKAAKAEAAKAAKAANGK